MYLLPAVVVSPGIQLKSLLLALATIVDIFLTLCCSSNSTRLPSWALSEMTYLDRPVIRRYLDPTTRDDSVDQLWINILHYYFNNLDYFGIEAQSRPHQSWDYRSNVVVTNVRNHMLAKFLFVENKRISFEDNPTIWDDTRDQLEDYMRGARNDQGNIQTLYGIVGIGNKARFYQLPMNGTALVPYGPAQELNIEDDHNTIDGILQYLATNCR